MLMIVKVSSRSPSLRFLSIGVLAVIEGLPFTSISHGFKLLSSIISNPYNSKHLLSVTITFEVAIKVLITSYWI